MYLSQENQTKLLKRWIESDPDLKRVLRPLQLDFLYERLINKVSFKQIAIEYLTSKSIVTRMFDDIVKKVEQEVGSDLAELIRSIDDEAKVDNHIGIFNFEHFNFDEGLHKL